MCIRDRRSSTRALAASREVMRTSTATGSCLRTPSGTRISSIQASLSAAGAAGKPFLSQAAIDHGAIYDTKGLGHGNTGHTFGDRLTADERRAVIEFLKSLSGPDM